MCGVKGMMLNWYFKNLYTSTCTNPNDDCFAEFNSSTLPKLTPQQADSCNGLLSKEECFASLKQFSKGKSPGTDGLTLKFYLSVWELLGQELVDSLNHAFQRGELSISQKRGIIGQNCLVVRLCQRKLTQTSV